MAKETGRKPNRSNRNHSFRLRAFTRHKDFKNARFDWSALREVFGALLLLALMVFLFVLFSSVPRIVGLKYGHGWGILISLLEFPALALLGVRPQPGVVQGAFCIVIYLMVFCIACQETVAYATSLFR